MAGGEGPALVDGHLVFGDGRVARRCVGVFIPHLRVRDGGSDVSSKVEEASLGMFSV